MSKSLALKTSVASRRRAQIIILLEIKEILWYSKAYKKDMAITKNAKKALRVSTRRRVVNDRVRRTMKETVKVVRKGVADKDVKALKSDLALAFQALDKAAKKGTIKKGTASRKKSRLAKAVAKISK